VDKIFRTSPAFSNKGQQGSSSFLKKRTKKLLLAAVRTGRIRRVNRWRKSLLVLFFRKELLPCFASVSVSMRVGMRPLGVERQAGEFLKENQKFFPLDPVCRSGRAS